MVAWNFLSRAFIEHLPPLHRLNRSHDVNQSAALEVALAIEVRRAGEKDPLHVLGVLDELAPDRQERGNDSGHVRRRLARAAALAIARGRSAAALPAGLRASDRLW